MELRSQRHRVDHDRVFIGIVVEDHDLQQSTRSIGADEQVPTLSVDDPDRVTQGVLDVLVVDAMTSSTVSDLHVGTRVPCLAGYDKVSLS